MIDYLFKVNNILAINQSIELEIIHNQFFLIGNFCLNQIVISR